MVEMTEAELSLKVATIMYPDKDWDYTRGLNIIVKDGYGNYFDYKDRACAFDMAVWLANQDNADIGSYPSLIMSEIITEENPQYALAMAIKDIGDSDEM